MKRAFIVMIVSASMAVAALGGNLDGRFERQIERSKSVLNTDPQLALRNGLSLRRAARSDVLSGNQFRYLATADWLVSAALVSLNQPARSLLFSNEGLTYARKISPAPSKLIGDLRRSQAAAYGYLGNVEQSIRGMQDAFAWYKQAGDLRGQALSLQFIGWLYSIALDYPRAVKYYRDSEEIYSLKNYTTDSAVLLAASFNQGLILMDQGKFADAHKQFLRALNAAQQSHSEMLEARTFCALASSEMQAGHLGAAEQSLQKSMVLSERLGTRSWLLEIFQIGAELALRKGELGRADLLIQRALNEIRSNDAEQSAGPVYKTAYQLAKLRNDPASALRYLELFSKVDDRKRALAASTNTALMSARFDFANQNVRIAQLRQRESQQEAALAKGRTRFLIVLLAGTGVVVVLLGIGFVSIRRSRNEVRAANDELSATNVELEHALAARTEFLATTSHEIRTPLNGVLGMTQVLLADRTLEPSTREKIELVQGAGETMKALVDDILDVAKIAKGELTVHKAEMDLHRLLRDAGQIWQGQAEAKGIVLAVDAGDAPERIVEDEVRLRQIVFNLLANAVKFTDRGSVRLAVEVIGGEPRSAAARLPDAAEGGAAPAIPAAAPPRLRVAVADTGIGIPADRVEDVFESFRQVDGGTTRRHGGTGLGLAICRSLARAMGGDVTVASILGAGSTFTLDLPLEAAAARGGPRAAPASLAGARLLLVEANPLNRSVLGALLGAQAAAVDVAEDAEGAHRVLAHAPVDLVLADAATLDGDLGQVARLAAAAAAGGGRTVLLWSAPDEATVAAAVAAGAERVIAKPIAAPALVAALKALYGEPAAPAGIAA